MCEVAWVLDVARAATDDITPLPLREIIHDQLEAASTTPGVLTQLSARQNGDGENADEVDRRAAGVQLIYGGLALARSLIQHEPWTAGDDEKAAGDTKALASNVMVARGAYLLARTEASDTAVEIIRAFGSDQTLRHETGDASYDGNLELDLLELAVVAGGSIDGAEPPYPMLEFATDLAHADDSRRIPEPSELYAGVAELYPAI